jgi:SOS-response transcriptional repressor LexA
MNIEITRAATEATGLIGERIRSIRIDKKMTQKEFAVSLGIVQGFLCAIEKGRKLPSNTLRIALQHQYKINTEWLNTGVGERYRSRPLSTGDPSMNFNTVPMLKEPPATLERIDQDTCGFISMPGIPDQCFAYEYKGDFMNPTIRDGDIVIVRMGNQQTSGDIVLFAGKWGDSFLRRFRRRGDEDFYSADNSAYAPFKTDKNIKILGTVAAVWRKITI